MVPVGSLIMMAADAVLGIAIPILLSVYLVRKHHAKLSTILIGAGTFILFALVLESIMHQLVLKGPYGASIMDKTLRYAIYGGLAAGVFEETGRFLSMKFLMKKEPSAPLPGVAYGIGHGGVEMLVIFGITMINNLAISTLINSGQTEVLFSKVPEEAVAWYKSRGYNFLGLSDHNIFQNEPDSWVTALRDKENPFRPEWNKTPTRRYIFTAEPRYFDAYLKAFPDAKTRTAPDGRLEARLSTFDELSSRFNAPEEFLLLPDVEATRSVQYSDGRYHQLHMNYVNIPQLLPSYLEKGFNRREKDIPLASFLAAHAQEVAAVRGREAAMVTQARTAGFSGSMQKGTLSASAITSAKSPEASRSSPVMRSPLIESP